MRLIAFSNDQGRPALGARIEDELVDLTASACPPRWTSCCVRDLPVSMRRTRPQPVPPAACR